MLPRSTAWRHGDGRTWTNATSISSSSPERDHQVARLMSRCAIRRPTSSGSAAALVDHRVIDLGFADSTAPVWNSVTSRYSRSG